MGNGKFDLKPSEMMALSAVENAAILVLVPLILAAMSGARLRDLGLVTTDLGKQAARGLVAYPLLAPLVFGAMGLASSSGAGRATRSSKRSARTGRQGWRLILILAGVVLAPAAEELIFRGVLLGWLTGLAIGSKPAYGHTSMSYSEVDEYLPADAGPHLLETVEIESPEESSSLPTLDTAEQTVFNPYAAPSASIATATIEPAPIDSRSPVFSLLVGNVAVSLVFAALHGAVWPTPIPIFFLSLGLGFLYQRTGSLFAPIALHMTFNGVSTAMMFLMLWGNPAPKPDPKAVDPVPPPAKAAKAAFEARELGFQGVEIRAIRPLTAFGGFDTVFFPKDWIDDGWSIGAESLAALESLRPISVRGMSRPEVGFFR